MVFEFVKNVILKSDKPVKQKFVTLRKYYSYNNNLKEHLKKGDLFLKNENNEICSNFLKKISKNDKDIIKKLFENDVKDFLKKCSLKQKLDFKKSEDFKQLGQNFIYVEEPIRGLWNTGMAKIYMPTKIGQSQNFEISIFSIAPLSILIGFEGEKVLEKEISQTSKETIEFSIQGKNVKNEISELFINTDKFWLPNLITNGNEIIPVGVGIESIKVS